MIGLEIFILGFVFYVFILSLSLNGKVSLLSRKLDEVLERLPPQQR